MSKFLFLVDSGSSCCLLKENFSEKFPGTVRNDLVYLSGIGGDEIRCSLQILSDVDIGGISRLVIFHLVPDRYILEPVIIGRNILEKGVGVQIDGESCRFILGRKIFL